MPRWAVPVFVDPGVPVWDILTIFSVQSKVPVVFGPALTLEERILTIFSVQSRVPIVFGNTLTLEGTGPPQKVLKIFGASDCSLVVSQPLLTQEAMLFSASCR